MDLVRDFITIAVYNTPEWATKWNRYMTVLM